MIRRYKINYENSYSHIGGSNYYLPCEITHWTSQIYYNDKEKYEFSKKIKRILGCSNETVFEGVSWGYYQDPYIQIYNGIEYKNFYNMYTINTVISDPIKISKFTDSYERISPENIQEGEQSKGGNFISAPNHTIFCVNGAKIELLDKLRSDTTKQIVELECGFKGGISEEFPNGSFRHIDELMCFMPYGVGEYKVWFYDQLDETSFQKLLQNHQSLNNIVQNNNNEIDTYRKLYYEYNSQKNKQLADKYWDCRQKLVNETKNITNEYIRQTIQELNDERMRNLEKISMALFEKPFSECTSKFVFFKFYSYKPSILNRVWYKTNEKCICLFPDINDPAIKQQVMEEMRDVSSYITPGIKPEFHFITVPTPDELIPEGTVHCLIKQRFVKPN